MKPAGRTPATRSRPRCEARGPRTGRSVEAPRHRAGWRVRETTEKPDALSSRIFSHVTGAGPVTYQAVCVRPATAKINDAVADDCAPPPLDDRVDNSAALDGLRASLRHRHHGERDRAGLDAEGTGDVVGNLLSESPDARRVRGGLRHCLPCTRSIRCRHMER